jgi:hypothetical protein
MAKEKKCLSFVDLKFLFTFSPSSISFGLHLPQQKLKQHWKQKQQQQQQPKQPQVMTNREQTTH